MVSAGVTVVTVVVSALAIVHNNRRADEANRLAASANATADAANDIAGKALQATKSQADTERDRLHMERTPTYTARIAPRSAYVHDLLLHLRLDSHHPIASVEVTLETPQGVWFADRTVEGSERLTAAGGPLNYGRVEHWWVQLTAERHDAVNLRVRSTDAAGAVWDTTVSDVHIPTAAELEAARVKSVGEPTRQ